MSSFEFNKILAAILLAAIIIVIIGLVGDFFINNNKKAGQQTAYKIEIPESNSEIAASASQEINIEPVEALLSTSSIKNGQKIFKKCGACHTYEKDGQQKIGPNLWNVINRKKGAIEGFAYSNALIQHGGIWGYEELNKFLYKPKDYIDGTKMNFVGLKKIQDRADLILWLREQSDNPVSLP